MIVFVNVSDGCKTAAFFDTVCDRFLETAGDAHGFKSLDEIDEIDRMLNADLVGAGHVSGRVDRLRSLVPKGFFDEPVIDEAFVKERLEAFLAEFRDDATSWADATSELSDMYAWMTDRYRAAWVDGEIVDEAGPLLPVGRKNCHTPTEWNTKYKAAIRAALLRFDETLRARFARRFKKRFEQSLPYPKMEVR